MSDETQVFSLEEKDALAKDLQMISNVIQAHDQTIFQIIASLNAVQAILLEKELTTQDELVAQTQKELTKMQENFMKELKEKQESQIDPSTEEVPE